MPRTAFPLRRSVTLAAAVLALAGQAQAQVSGSEMRETLNDAGQRATKIVSQPVRDIGLMSKPVPETLKQAGRDPYSLTSAATCTELDAEIAKLDDTLGPQAIGTPFKESRVGKFAEAGGKTLVNSIVPFRTMVREVSGAAPADRRIRAAVNDGHERRGFLRGVYMARGCGEVASAAVEASARPKFDSDPD